MFNSWFNPQNAIVSLRHQKISQLREYFPDCIQDSRDESVVYVPFGPGKKCTICILFGKLFPSGPPTIQLINVPDHSLADAHGNLSNDIHPDLRNWNINKSFGRIIWEVVAELLRLRVNTIPYFPSKTSRNILLEALEKMR